MSDAPFRIREARQGDMAFVASAWLESYRVRVARKIENRIRQLVRTSSVRVACDREDDDTLLGFASHDGPELHYAYVIADLRSEGIARALIPENTNAYTFRTEAGLSRIKPEERGWEYRPRIVL